MKCGMCKDLLGEPVEMVNVYVKNQVPRIKQNFIPYSHIGWLCPQCKSVKLMEKIK